MGTAHYANIYVRYHQQTYIYATVGWDIPTILYYTHTIIYLDTKTYHTAQIGHHTIHNIPYSTPNYTKQYHIVQYDTYNIPYEVSNPVYQRVYSTNHVQMFRFSNTFINKKHNETCRYKGEGKNDKNCHNEVSSCHASPVKNT